MTDRTAAVKLTLRNQGFVAGLREAKSQARDFADSVQQGAKRNKGSLDTLAHNFGAVGLAAAGVAAVAVKRFADFDAAMSNVQAATHETAGNMQALREAAIQAGKDTAFSATEAAGAIENLAKAGVSTQDILGGGLSGALSLAAAGQLDVADAAEIAATAMTQFKLSGKEVPHIADLLAAAAGKAQGDVTDIAMALKQGGLVASQFGLTIEETTGTLAAFASAGLIGSDAGTSFKTMLLALANPSVKAANTLQDLGIAAYDTKGQFVGIAPLAEQLKTKLQGLTPAQRDAALATIFGSDAIRAANVLYQNGAKGITDWTAKVNDQGYAAETAAIKMDNLKGDLEQLGGSIETALIQSGEGANSMLRSLVQNVTDGVNAFADLPPWVQKSALAFTGLAAAGGLGAAGIVKGVQAAAQLREALQTLSKAGKGLSFSLGGVGIALLAAGALYTAFAKHNAEAKQRASELRDTLDQQTGAITKNTRAYVSNQLATTGIAQKAKDLGLSLSLVTDAALGNEDALSKVRAQLDAVANANMDPNTGALGDQAKAARDVGLALGDMNKSLKDASTQQNLAAEGAKQNKSAQQLQADAVKKASEAFHAQEQSLNDMIDALHQASNAALELSGSQIGVQAAIDDAAKAAKENGKTLDINTEKGRANRSALNDLATAANKQTDAMLKSGSSNLEAAKTAESSRAQFVKVAGQMGLNKKQAEALAKSLIDIPNVEREAKLNADKTDLDQKLAAARKQLADPKLTATKKAKLQAKIAQLLEAKKKAQAAIDALHGTTVPVHVTVTATVNAANIRDKVNAQLARAGYVPGRASGGDVELGHLYKVGEAGPEYFVAPSNGVILNAEQTRQIDAARFNQTSAAPAAAGVKQAGQQPPIYVDNHIEIGGEVVRVVRTEIKAGNTALKRRVTAGRGR